MPGFFDGFTFWLRGWRMLLSEGSLMALSIIPLVIAVGAGGGVLYFVYGHLSMWVHQIVAFILGSYTGMWTQVIYYPLVIGSGIVVLLGGIFTGYIVHALLAIPFYALLAEKALSILELKPDSPFDFQTWLRNSLRMFRVSAVKTILFVVLATFLFVLSFVPVINVFALLGTLLIMSFDLLDYSLEGLRFGLRQRFGFALRHKRMWLGMACGLALTMFVPGLTFFIAPGAVVGGAILIKESNGSRGLA